ncbi:hypothetical protein HRQ87_00185 [Sulfitobacter sp. 1151]|uniref:Uncharacterized protein n=1 Tax=Parasulfitobacter algicola TaxID=2614809 RepID=A0ABX2IS78_9RHOB|nr:hypothetical protein [Sulfitobacter algicola]
MEKADNILYLKIVKSVACAVFRKIDSFNLKCIAAVAQSCAIKSNHLCVPMMCLTPFFGLIAIALTDTSATWTIVLDATYFDPVDADYNTAVAVRKAADIQDNETGRPAVSSTCTEMMFIDTVPVTNGNGVSCYMYEIAYFWHFMPPFKIKFQK